MVLLQVNHNIWPWCHHKPVTTHGNVGSTCMAPPARQLDRCAAPATAWASSSMPRWHSDKLCHTNTD